MLKIHREYQVNMFTPALENSSNAELVVLSWEGENSILTKNPYIWIGDNV